MKIAVSSIVFDYQELNKTVDAVVKATKTG